MGTFLSVLGIFGGRAYQVYYSATIARQQVRHQHNAQHLHACQALGAVRY